MIIKYNKFDDYTRKVIRSLENMGHIGYVRYLLMTRMKPKDIQVELLRLGLSEADESSLALYFETVLYPVITKHKLKRYYSDYRNHKTVERLSFRSTFHTSETDRIYFLHCVAEMGIDHFFAKEVRSYYGSAEETPTHENGKHIITTERIPDWAELLHHPKRYLIDSMLVDGKTPSMISNHLDVTYDIQIPKAAIAFYAKSFFHTRRRDLEQTIEVLEDEKERLEGRLQDMREHPDEEMSHGERAVILTNLKQKISELDAQIKRVTGAYSASAFTQGVLEAAGMREIFADVMLRTHRRYVQVDDNDEFDVIPNLSTLVGMMTKVSDKIIGLDEVMKAEVKKTIAEEMLEVVMPTLDRIEQQEREAMESFKTSYQESDQPSNDDDILGFDD